VLILVIAGIRSVTADHSTEGPAESAGTIAPVQQPAAQFMASQIVAEYEANEVAADGRYKGRTIVVSGTIETIGKDISDTPYVTLKGGEYEFRSVQAFFEEKDLAQLAQLRKGQDVYIEGTCAGLMMNVLLKGSRLVERTQR
jgi:hypothetical protein